LEVQCWSLCCETPWANNKLLHYKVIKMSKVIILHWYAFDDAPLLHPFFLTPKVKCFKIIEHIWFTKKLVGRNTLGKLCKKLIDDIPTLKGKWITNKIGRGIVISRMSKSLVLVEYGMKILSCRNTKSYVK